MSYRVIGLITMIIVFNTACDNNSVNEDMDAYCNCIKENEPDCHEMVKKIVDKYQFDPEASKVIEERIKDCTH